MSNFPRTALPNDADGRTYIVRGILASHDLGTAIAVRKAKDVVKNQSCSSHAYSLSSGVNRLNLLEAAVGDSVIDELAHRERRFSGETFDDAGGNVGDAVGLAPVVTKAELVEIGLQMYPTRQSRAAGWHAS